MIKGLFRRLQYVVAGLLLISLNFSVLAQSNEDCMMCHEDASLRSSKPGNKSLFVNDKIVGRSVHAYVKCASCHPGAADADFTHAGGKRMDEVNCGSCHAKAQRNHLSGMHGQALKFNAKYAPDCKECHGLHDILPPDNPKSLTYKTNIPILCGKCHREGAAVARIYNIGEHNIVENYSQGIHGRGLFEKGLIVTATCNNCHGNHLVLPHTSPNSSVSPEKIAETCMKCHLKIEEVHKKIIKGELWEEAPGSIPACSSCHPPHKVNVEDTVSMQSDQICMKCHATDETFKMVEGEKVSLRVDPTDLTKYMHKNIPCIKCHTDVDAELERPCEPAKKIDCSNCHAEVSKIYFSSGHGQAYVKKDPNAPYCTKCHGTHMVKSRYDDTAPIYKTAIPYLCGECHRKDGKAVEHSELIEIDAFADYSTSVHGKGLIDKGLVVTAVCTDCHSTHLMLKSDDERSSIHSLNIPATCGKCHKGIYEEYIVSDHSISKESDDKDYPNCADCHSAHVISDIDGDKFLTEVTVQCGNCHKDLAITYKDTYHGKAYQLGYLKAAKCSDCHGAHNVLKKDNPNSSIGENNIVATCAQCHPNANKEFTNFMAHATHNDRENYPILYYAFWGMTSLLIFVFVFFGIHTLLWLPASLRERKKHPHEKGNGAAKYYVRRFNARQRTTHIFVILSFILLALTGMTLKFAYMEWAQSFSIVFGGVKGAGVIHRIGAIITFGYFAYHLLSIVQMRLKSKTPFMKALFGSRSLMFSRQDLRDFKATIKWFLGKGPRPQYGRWTYWEKFDYMAVFWGVAVIGFSGLILWFPEFFTRFLPGWVINVSQIIHSDEALLAVGFIFTIHFFNTHFRPEAFPMDTVIFTGHIPLDEFKRDRPREYKELEESGRLKDHLRKIKFSDTRMKVIKTFGFIFLSAGIILTILIIYSLLFG